MSVTWQKMALSARFIGHFGTQEGGFKARFMDGRSESMRSLSIIEKPHNPRISTAHEPQPPNLPRFALHGRKAVAEDNRNPERKKRIRTLFSEVHEKARSKAGLCR